MGKDGAAALHCAEEGVAIVGVAIVGDASDAFSVIGLSLARMMVPLRSFIPTQPKTP